MTFSSHRPSLRVGVSTVRFEHPVYPRPSSNGPGDSGFEGDVMLWIRVARSP